MKYLIPLLLLAGVLNGQPSQTALELVDAMKLTEKYSFTYGKYQSYGAAIELEEDVLKELPDKLRVSGLRAKIASHLETSLTKEELKKAHAFFQTEAGKKLGVATSYSTHNFPELDMYAAQWGSERNNKLKEIVRLRSFGGKEAMPYVQNLRNIVSACQQYMLEEGKKEASYADVVGTYFKEIEPINGESYKEIEVTAKGGKVSVTNADGKVFEYKY